MQPVNLNYTDASVIPSWATEQVKTCVSAGVIGGYSDGTIRPNGNITRGEIAENSGSVLIAVAQPQFYNNTRQEKS